MKTQRAFAIAFTMLLLLLVVRVQATTYYVNGGMGNNAYDGLTNIVVSSTDGPKMNVTNALAAASSGDTLAVADGFYQELQWDLGGKDLSLNPDGNVIVYSSNPWYTYTIGDGISDGWRQYYFADPATTNGDSCASCDPDNDGQSNLYEYQAASDPLEYYSGLLQPPSCFTNQFNPNAAVIAIQPATNGCIFYAGESVTVTSSAPIEIYRLTYGGQTASYTNGASPLVISPPVGHYFAQSAQDRSEFVVLPSDYTTLSNIGTWCYWALGGSPEIGWHVDRAKLGWVRTQIHWSYIQTNNGGAFDWSAIDNGYPDVSNLLYWVGRTKIVFLTDTPAWARALSFTNFVSAYSNWLAAVYQRYSNQVDVLQAVNEIYTCGWTGENPWHPVFSNCDSSVYVNLTTLLQAVRTAWPKHPIIGPSDSSVWTDGRPAALTTAGGNVYLDALDMHDYWNVYNADRAAPDNPTNGIPMRCLTNLTELAKTNLFLTEIDFPGASAIGYTKPDIYPGNGSRPPFSWYRGLTRTIKSVVLYMQTNTVLLTFDMTRANEEMAGFDSNYGIKPKCSALLMTGHWLNHSKPLTNWISGNLHFAESVCTNGQSNTFTFVWSAEGTTVSTNLGVLTTDIYSNEWSGDIGEEPVIAWGWPPP
jgi:hypothetical protein